MTINHIDQLAEWWENAEKGAPNKGDTIIRQTERLLSSGYAYEVGTEDYTDARHLDNVRILARAPKPKPAWHGAVAVMARCSNAPEGHREPFIRSEATRDVWAGEAGHARTEDLRDVTPLIEAKVTDEMVLAALNGYGSNNFSRLDTYEAHAIEDMRIALAAALGIEAE